MCVTAHVQGSGIVLIRQDKGDDIFYRSLNQRLECRASSRVFVQARQSSGSAKVAFTSLD